jgi:hypothetical protein
MFDYVKILYEMPWPEVQDNEWQSKETPEQNLDHYVIREDGTLWHEACEVDFDEFKGTHRVNERWEHEIHSGGLECRKWVEHVGCTGGTQYSINFWFRDGVVKDAIFTKG